MTPPRAFLRGFDSVINEFADILTVAAYTSQRQQPTQSPHISGDLQVPALKLVAPSPSVNGAPPTHPGSDEVTSTKSTAATVNLPRVRPLVPFEIDSDL